MASPPTPTSGLTLAAAPIKQREESGKMGGLFVVHRRVEAPEDVAQPGVGRCPIRKVVSLDRCIARDRLDQGF